MKNYATLDVKPTEGVQRVTLNRPERRNALTAEMIAELTETFADFGDSPHAQVLLLTGAGEAFCSGLDLEELRKMARQPESAQRESSKSIATMLRTLHECPKPTIAAVNGAAVAGGMGLATICDFTIAVPTAKFGYPEVKIGFVPAIVSAFLRNQVGAKVAADLLLTGRLIEAAEALQLGLVSRIVGSADLLSAAHALAGTLMKNSPQSLMATKCLLREQGEAQLTRDLASAAEANARIRQTDDFAEGLAAFLEKRKPVWKKDS